MKENDLFLVDDRIVPEMPRVLGKQWLQAKKSPIPVTLKRVDLKAEFERAISSTYLRINRGTSLAIKVGSLSAHSNEEILENLLAIIPHLAVRLPMGGWDNIQALHIKTTTSTSLPIWSCSLDAGDESDPKSRFFVNDVDEAEIEAKKKAKEEKDERIREKRLRKLESEARMIAQRNKGDDASDESEEEEEAATEPAELEEIDETIKSTSADKKDKRAKQLKSTDSPAKADRKKVSSTSKKMKGLDAVKGLPRKSKKA
jgi:ribosome biogenesis protein UTP30